MIVELQKVENGWFIPMIDQLKKIKKKKVLVDIEVVESNLAELKRKHREGYLLKPLVPGEFDDWEEVQND